MFSAGCSVQTPFCLLPDVSNSNKSVRMVQKGKNMRLKKKQCFYSRFKKLNLWEKILKHSTKNTEGR